MSKPAPNLTERVFSAAAWNTLLFPVQLVVGLVAGVLTVNTLLPELYGVLALLTGLAATIGLYADLGIERSLPRFLPEIEQRGGRAGVARFLARIIALKLALVLVAVALMQGFSGALVGVVTANQQQAAQVAQQHFDDLGARGVAGAELTKARHDLEAKRESVTLVQRNGRLFLWAVAALVLFGALYDVFMQFLTAYFHQRAWNIITVVVTLVQPLLIIVFLVRGLNLNGVLLGMVITPVVAVALAAWQVARAARSLDDAPHDASPDPTLPARFIRFAAMSFVTQLTNWLYDVAFVVFVLTAIGTPLGTVGLLSFAYVFAKTYLSYAYLPFGGLLTPLLTRIRARNDPAALQETYASITRLFALILVPAGVGLALLTPRILALLYPRYDSAETLTLIWLFIAFTFAESLLSVPHNVLMVYERYRPVLLARLAALISVPLLALLVPAIGLPGAALATGLARVAARVLTLGAVRRGMALRFPLRFVARVAAATAAFALPLALLLAVWPLASVAPGYAGKAWAALSLAVFGALGAAGYLAALRLLGGLDEQERKRILGLKLPFKAVWAKLL